MRYLHTMVRVCDLKKSLDFYCVKLGMRQVRRMENDKGRFTLVFLAAADDEETAKENRAPLLELTHNWDGEDNHFGGGRNFGHWHLRWKKDKGDVCSLRHINRRQKITNDDIDNYEYPVFHAPRTSAECGIFCPRCKVPMHNCLFVVRVLVCRVGDPATAQVAGECC